MSNGSQRPEVESRASLRVADLVRSGKKMAAPTRTGSNKSNKSDSAPTVNIKQKLVLSGEQQKVLQLVVSEGKNMFFTGSAGASRVIDGMELGKQFAPARQLHGPRRIRL